MTTITMFRTETREELLAIYREPTALFFGVLMPVGFFALFVAMFGGESMGGLQSVATYGAFGALAMGMMNPGIAIADSRERGWLNVKRVSGVPLPVTLAAKVAGSLPYAVVVVLAITATAIVAGAASWDTSVVGRILVALVIGVIPFSLFSLAIGARAGANATTAILNAILLPSVIISGMWFPFEIMPDVVQRIAGFVPTYHLAQLAAAQVDGSGWMDHVFFLLGTTAVGAVAAGLAYRSAGR
jgi:ABC-2 type transport system permease protein